MNLENAMRQEMKRLEKEIELIDSQLEKHHGKILNLLAERKKNEHDLHALRSGFDDTLVTEQEKRTLEEIMKNRLKV